MSADVVCGNTFLYDINLNCSPYTLCVTISPSSSISSSTSISSVSPTQVIKSLFCFNNNTVQLFLSFLKIIVATFPIIFIIAPFKYNNYIIV